MPSVKSQKQKQNDMHWGGAEDRKLSYCAGVQNAILADAVIWGGAAVLSAHQARLPALSCEEKERGVAHWSLLPERKALGSITGNPMAMLVNISDT